MSELNENSCYNSSIINEDNHGHIAMNLYDISTYMYVIYMYVHVVRPCLEHIFMHYAYCILKTFSVIQS